MARVHVLVDDPRGTQRRQLEERLEAARSQVQPDTMPDLLEGLAGNVLRAAFQNACATEGSLWLYEEVNHLHRMVFNTGPNAKALVGNATQPAHDGLISMVFSTEQAFVENAVPASLQHSKEFDRRFAQATLTLLAVPFYLMGRACGVVSCVTLAGADTAVSAKFTHADLAHVEMASRVVGALIDYKLLRLCAGLSDV